MVRQRERSTQRPSRAATVRLRLQRPSAFADSQLSIATSTISCISIVILSPCSSLDLRSQARTAHPIRLRCDTTQLLPRAADNLFHECRTDPRPRSRPSCSRTHRGALRRPPAQPTCRYNRAVEIPMRYDPRRRQANCLSTISAVSAGAEHARCVSACGHRRRRSSHRRPTDLKRSSDRGPRCVALSATRVRSQSRGGS
jgi:hypothetical protein